MRAGELDRRVVIESNTPTRTASGDETEVWTTFATRSARKIDLAGDEQFRGRAIAAEISTIFTIRDLAGITVLMRISLGGLIYDIRGIKEIGRGEGHELHTVARAP